MKSVSGIHTPIKNLKHLKWTRLFLITDGGKYDKENVPETVHVYNP